MNARDGTVIPRYLVRMVEAVVVRHGFIAESEPHLVDDIFVVDLVATVLIVLESIAFVSMVDVDRMEVILSLGHAQQ